ncbi:MAG: hypothetical protein HC804_01095 [Anaerolineae bacterium]|nr:hypothetical protein [Anaerolineae bacterium]
MNHPPTIQPRKWHIAPPMPTVTRDALGHVHPVLRQVLYNRGITSAADAQAFLEGRYLGQTDPYLLADMDTAVSRIQRAIAQDENHFMCTVTLMPMASPPPCCSPRPCVG